MVRFSLRRGSMLAAALVLAFASSASAQIVVPNLPDLGGGTNTSIRNAARTYQSVYYANNFSSLTQPTTITGMQFRIYTGPINPVGQSNPWPSQALSFSQYDVQLSQPTAQLVTDGEYLSLAPTFASYQGAGLTTVRSGGLNIPAGSFQNLGGATNAFGFEITFSTPYTYNPGEGLVLNIRHSGYSPAGEINPFMSSVGFVNGTADAIASTVGAAATVPNSFSSPYIVQFNFAPVPEPTSMALCGIAALVGGWKLRRRNNAVVETTAI